MEDDLTVLRFIDGLSVPIATTTAGRIDFANRQFVDYVGMSLEELSDWETSGVVHPDDLPRVATVWRQSLERGEPHEADQRIRRADGIYQWIHVRGVPHALDRIESLQPRAVVAGHGVLDPDSSPRHIEETRRYIRDFDACVAATTTPRELYERMLSWHPNRVNPGSLWAAANAVKPS
jgi:PAS domain S-box-containing protein